MSRSSLEVVEPLAERDRLAERTYEALRDAVLSSRIPPGTALSVPELARRLDVSRSPVREAVQRLIYDGLASHMPNRGAVVNRMGLDELADLYLVREVLEGLATRLAAETIDANGLGQLHALLDAHKQLRPDPIHVQEHVRLDAEFHRQIRILAGNGQLSETLDSIATRSHFAARSLWSAPRMISLSLLEHETILDAMMTGDPDAAELAAREHIARVRIRLRHSERGDAADNA